MRAKLQRALKAGHAEATFAIVRVLPPTVRDLELAMRCRRAALLATVLARCEISVVRGSLRGAETDPKNAWARESKLFDIPGFRRQLLEVQKLLSEPKNAEVLASSRWCGMLCLKRVGGSALPLPIRRKVLEYLTPSVNVLACQKLEELLKCMELMAIPLAPDH